MPEIISNSSPIIHLAKIGQIHLLQEFYENIAIPSAVYEECTTEGKDREEVSVIKNADWLNVYSVRNTPLVRLLLSELDRGESEAIILALERRADLMLLDDTDAREKAKLFSIPMTGTLGILLRAKYEGKLESFREAFEQLRATGFWINERLRKRFFTAAGEI